MLHQIQCCATTRRERRANPNKRPGASSLGNTKLFGDLICDVFKAEPRKEVFEVSIDRKRHTNAVFPVHTDIIDLIVMLVKKCVSVGVEDQSSYPSGNAAMTSQVDEKSRDIFIFQSFLGDFCSDISLGKFLAKNVSHFRVCQEFV